MFAIANLIQLSFRRVTYAVFMRFVLPILCFMLCGCDRGIYTRDGVTDGDTFYLAPAAFANDDPVYQSWVTYSLIKSTCQLELSGPIPARASSFDCEFRSRRHLANAWEEKLTINQAITDEYLDGLAEVHAAGFLAEYTAHYFGRDGWQLPEGLRRDEFRSWRRQHLKGHRPITRITGSWNFQHDTIESAGYSD